MPTSTVSALFARFTLQLLSHPVALRLALLVLAVGLSAALGPKVGILCPYEGGGGLGGG